MGARQPSSSKKAISPRSLKRQVSDFILTDSVAKSPKELCDNEVCLSDDEDLLDVDKHTPRPLSPNLSWLEALEAEHTPLSPKKFELACRHAFNCIFHQLRRRCLQDFNGP